MSIFNRSFFQSWMVIFLVTGCSGGSNEQQSQQEFQNIQEQESGFFDQMKSEYNGVKARLSAGQEALQSASEIVEKQPGVLNILQGNATDADWQGLDKQYLKKKAQELKKIAESVGITLDHEPTAAERALLEKAGAQMGISKERSAELEAILKRRRERLMEKGENQP